MKSEREEGLWQWTLIFRTKAVIKLRMNILSVIAIHTDRCPTKMLQIVIQLDKEDTIVSVDISTLSL